MIDFSTGYHQPLRKPAPRVPRATLWICGSALVVIGYLCGLATGVYWG